MRLNNIFDDGIIGYILGIFAGLFLSLAMDIKSFVVSLFGGILILLTFSLLVALFTYKQTKSKRGQKTRR